MRRLLQLAVLALGLIVAATSGTLADHMNGQYRGSGDVEGTFLSIQQSGTAVLGRITGASTGTMQARSNGGDDFQGVVNIEDEGQFQIVGRWSAEGITIILRDASGEGTLFFTPVAGEAGGGGGPGGNQAPADGGGVEGGEGPGAEASGTQQQSDARFFVFLDGNRTGPLSFGQVDKLIANGVLTRSTFVWRQGLTDWVRAESVPELAEAFPPEVPRDDRYFVAENGQRVGPLTLPEVIERIEAGTTVSDDLVWKPGLPDWAEAASFEELEEALAAFETPPPPQEETQAPAEDTPPPLPGEADDEASGSAAGGPGSGGAGSGGSTAGESSTGLGETRSTVALPDGRTLIVVGGGNQAIFPNDAGGFQIVADGVEIVVIGEAVSVNGIDRPPVTYARNLEIRISGRNVTLTPDVER